MLNVSFYKSFIVQYITEDNTVHFYSTARPKDKMNAFDPVRSLLSGKVISTCEKHEIA